MQRHPANCDAPRLAGLLCLPVWLRYARRWAERGEARVHTKHKAAWVSPLAATVGPPSTTHAAKPALPPRRRPWERRKKN